MKKVLILSCLFTIVGLSVNGNQFTLYDSLSMDSLYNPQGQLKILSWNIGMLPVLDMFKDMDERAQAIANVLTRNSHLIQWIKQKVAVLKSKWGKNKEYLSDHNGLEAFIEFKSVDYLTKVYK